jgi:hypothetical protein
VLVGALGSACRSRRRTRPPAERLSLPRKPAPAGPARGPALRLSEPAVDLGDLRSCPSAKAAQGGDFKLRRVKPVVKRWRKVWL